MGLEILLVQFIQIAILTCATFSVAMVFLLLFMPNLFERIAKTSNFIVSTKKLLEPLEISRETETKTSPYLHKLAFLILIISGLSLFVILSNDGLFDTAHFIKQGTGMEWLISILVQSLSWFFLVFLSFSIIISLIILLAPQKFPDIAIFFNQWVSTNNVYSKLDRFKNFDSFFMKFKLPLGITCILLLLYVIYACFIKLIILGQ
ncbi:MAG: hypothetical protein KAI43_13820 [Candidatus Aureabacteria bacterium]|nr:hypothetical protein [Candidatus Auribacterota bacterium]